MNGLCVRPRAKALALLLASVCVAAVGCGGGAEKAPVRTQVTTGTATTPSPIAEARPTTEPTPTLPEAPVAVHPFELSVINADGTGLRPIATYSHYRAAVPGLLCQGLDWSPDGKKLALATSPRPNMCRVEIVAMDGELERFSRDIDGDLYSVMWSPSGEWLALERTGYEDEDQPHRLKYWGLDILRSDGTALRNVHRAAEWETIVGWSPDEAKVLALSGGGKGGELVLIDIASGQSESVTKRTLGSERQARLSPDGTMAAFVRDEGAEACDCDGYCKSIWLANIDEGELQRLAELSCGAYVVDVAWSPNGGKLAYAIVGPGTEANGAYVVDMTARVVTHLTRPEKGFDVLLAWTPDGSHVLVRRIPCYGCEARANHGTPVLVPAGGGEEKPVVGADFYGLFALAPDGWRYAYGRDELRLNSLDGQEEATLVGNDPDFRFVDMLWSPDGQRLAFVREHSYGERRYAVRVDGSELIRLTMGPDQERFVSPDGQEAAFWKRADNAATLWVADVDGSNERRLTDMAVDTRVRPAWSPDGRTIAFFTFEAFYVVNADGRGLTKLGTDVRVDSVAWSPDGSRLAYFSSDQIVIFDALTGEASSVAPAPPLPPNRPPGLEWSPGSDKLVLWTQVSEDQTDLLVVSVDEGTRTTLASVYRSHWSPASWSPDGERIAFCDEGTLYAVSLADVGPKKVAQECHEGGSCGKPLWSPDGRQLAVHWGSGKPAGIYIVNAAGSGLAQLVGETGGAIRDITWSDDGQMLFFTTMRVGM